MNFESIDWKKDETTFHFKSAVLHQMITTLILRYKNWNKIPKEFINIMKSIGKRANEIRKTILENRYKESNPSIDDVNASEQDKQKMKLYTASGADYFNELIRYRLVYSIDKKRNHRDDSKCKKDYVQKSRMTSTFMIQRCPHRVAIGTHVARTAESVDDPFCSIVCMMNEAPEFVIIDNPCKAAAFSRLREYKFFENTVFIGDQLHQKGHKCGGCFDITLYKQGLSLLSNINDSAAEQGNNLLMTIRLSGTFMSLELLMIVVRMSLEFDNRRLFNKYDVEQKKNMNNTNNNNE